MEALIASIGEARRTGKRDISSLDPTAAGISREQAFSRLFQASAGPPGQSLTALPPRVTGPASVNGVIQQRDFGVNPRIKPFGRRYLALAGNKFGGMSAPGFAQLALVRKSKPRRKNARVGIEGFSNYDYSHGYKDPMGGSDMNAGFVVPGDALWAVTPLQWNFLMAKAQLNLAQKDAARYRKLRPIELFFGQTANSKDPNPFGTHMPDYEGWHADGIVEFERGETGDSTRRNEGYAAAAGQLMSPPPGAGKLVTVSCAGEVSIVDYFGGQGVQEGSRLYAILTKGTDWVSDPDEAGANTDLTYTLAQKAIDTQFSEGHYTHTIGNASFLLDPNDPDSRVKLRPYEWRFVAVANGGELPREYRQYKDEWGMLRSDAHVVYIGYVMWAPPGLVTGRTPALEQLRPLRDGRLAMSRQEIRIVAALEDGLFGLMA